MTADASAEADGLNKIVFDQNTCTKDITMFLVILLTEMTHLVVYLPLISLTDELLHLRSSKRVLAHRRAGVAGSVDLLRGVVIYDLIGAVCTSSR